MFRMQLAELCWASRQQSESGRNKQERECTGVTAAAQDRSKSKASVAMVANPCMDFERPHINSFLPAPPRALAAGLLIVPHTQQYCGSASAYPGTGAVTARHQALTYSSSSMLFNGWCSSYIILFVLTLILSGIFLA